ncbi:MAG TPA: flagellar basal body P-ring formation chaperone FlgA [Thermodesulfobacteriota bacterium]
MKLFSLIFFAIAFFLAPLCADARQDARSFVRDEIMKEIPWESSSVEIDEIEIPGLEAAVGYDSMRLNLPKRISSPGKVSYSLEVSSRDKGTRTVWGTAKIRVYRDAVVALKPIKGRTPIEADGLKVERVELDEAAEAFSSIEDLSGMVAERPISAGSVVKKSYVKPRVLVKRGERVTLTVQGEKITIRSSGVAAAEGPMGGTVAVRTRAGKEVLGTVAGPGEIVINF